MRKFLTMIFGIVALFVVKQVSYADDYASIKAKLAEEPNQKTVITFDNKYPQFKIGEKNYDILFYLCDYPWPHESEAFCRQVKSFRDADMDLNAIGFVTCEKIKDEASGKMREPWEGDFLALDLIEKRIYKALELNPDAYFVVYLTASYPSGWWMDKNPDELIQYATEPIDPKAVLGDYAFRAPSFASLKFRQEMGDVLYKMVKYLESTPAGKRVCAYRVDYGCFREWFCYGFANKLPDVSKPMLQAFRNYLRKTYNNDVAALRKAWGKSDVTFETADFPTVEERLKLGRDHLRDPKKNRAVIDYLHALHGEILATNIEFNKKVKEASNFRVPVGNYGGYFFGMHFGPEHRHYYQNERLMSQYTDFLASPFMYSQYRKFGEAGLAEGLFESPLLYNKVAILEGDSSTHLDKSKSRDMLQFATNSAESNAMLARDFGQVICRNAGMWFKDFNKNFYDDPEIVEGIRKMGKIRKLPITDNLIKKDVCFVADYESLLYMCATRWDKLYKQTVSDFVVELTHSGVPFETLSLADLERIDLDKFKVYVFPNLYYATPEKLALVNKLKKMGKKVFFSFAPGYLTENGRSLASFNEYSGMNVKKFPGTLNDKGQVIKVSDNVYYSTDGIWGRDELRKLFREAGVHVFTDNSEPIIYAGMNFVVFHSLKGGKQKLNLPEAREVDMCFPSDVKYGKTASIEFEMQPKSTVIFYVR
ncbi:MAG: hypothetical protein IJW31_10000 [Lentisphaeria bacterium]|nr:hypothetical protein [Lentisphaeria bacterium]